MISGKFVEGGVVLPVSFFLAKTIELAIDFVFEGRSLVLIWFVYMMLLDRQSPHISFHGEDLGAEQWKLANLD
jgi:hypothetical protein